MKLTATASKDLHAADSDELKGILAQFMEQVEFIINGNLGFTDNLKVFIAKNVQFTSVQYDIVVQHDLGRPAVGYIVIGRNYPLTVYNGVNQWTQDSIFLRSSAVGLATILIF